MVANWPGSVRGMLYSFLVKYCGGLFGIGSVRCINRKLLREESFTDGGRKLLKPRQETFSGKTMDVSYPRPAVDEVLVVRERSRRLWCEPNGTHAYHWSKQAQTTAAGVPADLLCYQVSRQPDLCRSRALKWRQVCTSVAFAAAWTVAFTVASSVNARRLVYLFDCFWNPSAC